LTKWTLAFCPHLQEDKYKNFFSNGIELWSLLLNTVNFHAQGL
jgi:hypothetical protein